LPECCRPCVPPGHKTSADRVGESADCLPK
jgi:hypothetical protein